MAQVTLEPTADLNEPSAGSSVAGFPVPEEVHRSMNNLSADAAIGDDVHQPNERSHLVLVPGGHPARLPVP